MEAGGRCDLRVNKYTASTKTDPEGNEVGAKDRRRLWGRSTQPCSMCAVADRPIETACAASLFPQQAARNHLRIIAGIVARPPNRSATAAFPNDNLAVLNIIPAGDYFSWVLSILRWRPHLRFEWARAQAA